ncbi:glycosyltransferase [Microvirga sp. TS319]|uniref:glycosyltransferase n=1 Tax=Microvirga sp. TS319 TaxID=3241165 RepID=UPI00351A27D0
MRVTVAICTWNRCQRLRRTLQSITMLDLPPGLWWELLVIDNASNDATSEVVSSFSGRLPVRCIPEPAPGLSHARNRAVREAVGEYIVFTDDDVLVDKDWLASYCRAFARWPGADVFGGPIEPLFEGTPPEWIHRMLGQIGPVFGRQYLGNVMVPLRPDMVSEGPYGANMAMSKAALLKFPFDPMLGVRHEQYRIGEETQVIRRMLLAGLEGWWSPEPKLQHVIPVESQSLSFVRRWMVGAGRTLGQPTFDGSTQHIETNLRLRLRILKYESLYLARRFTSDPEVWLPYLVISSQAQGRLLARRGSAAITNHGSSRGGS